MQAANLITAQKLNEEVLFMIQSPSSLDHDTVDEVEFLDVSSRKLALVVVGPNGMFNIEKGAGVKVIFGQLSWTDSHGHQQTRTQATVPFGTVSTVVTANSVHAGDLGAAFLLLKKSSTSGSPPYSNMDQLKTHNIFPKRVPEQVRKMKFDWVKVEDRPWANGRFKGVEFYNLVGFHVRLADDTQTNICHIQMWTAGVGVSAGFHNHTDAIFCEIHACIVNGTGKGGMSWATVPDADFDPAHPDKHKFDSVVVSDLHEHGPLWRTGGDGLPLFRKNATVDYPWHAWLAGPRTEYGTQSFDVWIAFEFPPFVARSVRTDELFPRARGIYTLKNTGTGKAPTVKDGDSTDGTPIVGVAAHAAGRKDEQWNLVPAAGTDACTLTNLASGSSATSNWPPFDGQRLVGSRTSAVLGITSNWALVKAGEHDSVKIGLIGTNLVWSMNSDNFVVLDEERRGDARQLWALEKVAED
ncbi:hypothetical protein BXZ70DRAFT_955522 [Cristinia sonorae]|uniref:Aldos-2-ulose dehydratase/isomerase (AUDH) Cupin domain-containing protein n=1 Tax=Cristinia sonorae TaxID=1940300 RepID=A0A8K0UHD9_9AGAR|nr:hypothetical protein BXZ70DRAFT_955522 [Cristinia sonorae]